MKYKGELYAKIAGRYIKLEQTSEDYDKLEIRTEELRQGLRVALVIIDRLSDEYSAVSNRHSSFTRGEYNQIMSVIHPEFKEPATDKVA